MAEQTFRVTRFGPTSSLVAAEEGLTEDEAIRLVRLATGLPLGGWHNKLAELSPRIIHVAPPPGYDPDTPNETIIVEASDA